MSNARVNVAQGKRALTMLGAALLVVDTLGRPDISARLQDVIDRVRELGGE